MTRLGLAEVLAEIFTEIFAKAPSRKFVSLMSYKNFSLTLLKSEQSMLIEMSFIVHLSLSTWNNCSGMALFSGMPSASAQLLGAHQKEHGVSRGRRNDDDAGPLGGGCLAFEPGPPEASAHFDLPLFAGDELRCRPAFLARHLVFEFFAGGLSAGEDSLQLSAEEQGRQHGEDAGCRELPG